MRRIAPRASDRIEAAPSEPDLVPLAMSMLEASRLKGVLDSALETLESTFPRVLWGILHRERLQRFAVVASSRLGSLVLRDVLVRACGATAGLSMEERPGTVRRLEGPVWSVVPSAPGRRRIPEVLLAAWTTPGSPLPMQSTLDRGACLIASGVRAAKVLESLLELNTRDPLTGLRNRRGILDVLRRERAVARRHGRSLSILYVDLNHFKEVNDQHGHAVGDELLSGAAAVLERSLRTTDVVGRVGGDEFLAILPDTDLAAARRIGKRLADSVSASPIATTSGILSLTLSVGASCLDEDTTGDGLLERADLRMLGRKRRRAPSEDAAEN